MQTRTGSTPQNGEVRSGRWIEVAGVFGFFALVLAHLMRFCTVSEMLSWLTPVAALLALVVADFFSGLVHWMADTWGSEDMPWIGPRLLRPFRLHHIDPLAMLHHDFLETNGNTGLLAIPNLLFALALPLDSALGRFVAVFLVAMMVWGFATNQIHKWAHTSDPPPVVRWLQGRGLILTPQHHEGHHTTPFARNYCITTGWCNTLLTAVGFFPALERCIAALTGLAPRSYELAQPADATPPPAAMQKTGSPLRFSWQLGQGPPGASSPSC